MPPEQPAVEPMACAGRNATIAVAARLRLSGTVPPEISNRLGTKVLAKLRSGSNLRIAIEFSADVSGDTVKATTGKLRQVLQELVVADTVRIEQL